MGSGNLQPPHGPFFPIILTRASRWLRLRGEGDGLSCRLTWKQWFTGMLWTICHIPSCNLPHSYLLMRLDEANIIIRQVMGGNISAMRKALNITQTMFAQMIGIDRSYLNRIEKGTENLSMGVLTKIADGLDVPLPRLMEGLESCPPRELPERHWRYSAERFDEE